MKFVLALSVLVLLAVFALRLRAAQDAPQVGAMAPEFTLPDQQGTPRRLSDYRGKWVVLYFYPKDETPGCTKEACAFRDDWQALTALNAQVIGVSLDDSQSHAQFASKHRLPFLLLADASGEVVERYGAMMNLVLMKLAKRHTFVIAPDGKVAQVYRHVDPGGHSREIIQFLKQVK
jgi:thioredoxin-dependent peroxiredoxin